MLTGHAGLDFAPVSDSSKLLALAVAGASGNGITLEASSIYFNFDYIGLDLKGAPEAMPATVFTSLPNPRAIVSVETSTGASGVGGQYHFGNTGNGVSLHGSSKNTIADNWIGTNDKGKVAIANGANGIWLTGGSNDNEIGGPRFTDSATGDVNNPTGNKGKDAPVFVVPPDGNLVSGNVRRRHPHRQRLEKNILNGNFVGTTADGDGTIANGGDGVRIDERPKTIRSIGCKVRDESVRLLQRHERKSRQRPAHHQFGRRHRSRQLLRRRCE